MFSSIITNGDLEILKIDIEANKLDTEVTLPRLVITAKKQ